MTLTSCVFSWGYSWKLQSEIEQGRNSTWKNPTDLPKVAVTWQDWDLVWGIWTPLLLAGTPCLRYPGLPSSSQGEWESGRVL